MNQVQCPVCQSNNLQDFWYWEKEDKLLRMWAMDTRMYLSICRDCSTIFQNPLVPTSSEDSSFSVWEEPDGDTLSTKEPLEWMRQFTGFGKEPDRALEIYANKPFFEKTLKEEGWDIKVVPIQSIIDSDQDSDDGSSDSPFEDGEEFDLIFCYNALEKTTQPIMVLEKIHDHLKKDGGLFVEVANPSVAPRVDKICLSSDEICSFPFQTLIYALYKAGFTNQSAEITGKNRCFCTKIDKNPDADATTLVPHNHWSHLMSRFQRNYNWAWAASFLKKYMVQSQTQPQFLEQTRELLRQRPEELAIIRDICGATLLFVQEIDTVRQTLESDWHITMSRIFEIFSKDYGLYDLLQTGNEMELLGTLPDVERYFYNEKVVFMTTSDYFKKYFTKDEATKLCNSIIQSGEVVCKTLSSFL